MIDYPTQIQRGVRWLLISWASPCGTSLLSWGLVDLVDAWHLQLTILISAISVGPVARMIAARWLRALPRHGLLHGAAVVAECILFVTTFGLMIGLAPEGATLWLRWLLATWCIALAVQASSLSRGFAIIGIARGDEFLPRAAPLSSGFCIVGAAIAIGESLFWMPVAGPSAIAIGIVFTLAAGSRASSLLRMTD